MITLQDYFQSKPHPKEHEENAIILLELVDDYLRECAHLGVYNWPVDPDTGTHISGSKGGSGDGGYRGVDSKTGTAKSMHRIGNAIDIFDPEQLLAKYTDTPIGREHLISAGLFIEHPRWTPGWLHVQSVAPRSGHRVFIPYNSPPLVAGWEGGTQIPFTIRT